MYTETADKVYANIQFMLKIKGNELRVHLVQQKVIVLKWLFKKKKQRKQIKMDEKIKYDRIRK